MRTDRKPAIFAALALGIALVAIAAGLGTGWLRAPAPAAGPEFSVTNETATLGSVYDPGVILGAASNDSTLLLGGIGVYTKVPEFTLPDLASLTGPENALAVTNLTPEVNSYFYEGGVYAMGWNGTAWLLGGQAGWGGGSNNWGSIVSLQDGVLTNRSALLGNVFNGGGVFAMGWNGTSWLIGGNSTAGPALVALTGTTLTDLTAQLPLRNSIGWLQYLGWNGREWLVGGEGVFGVLVGSTYTDLWGETPFSGSGVYAADWNGTAWLAGGGAGALVVVRDDSVVAAPPLADEFDQSVTLVAALPDGWLIGGTGSSPSGGFAPALAYWDGYGASATTDDLSPELPGSFDGGDLQSGCWAPSLGANSLLLVGEGDYDNTTGYGLGAMALLTIGGD